MALLPIFVASAVAQAQLPTGLRERIPAPRVTFAAETISPLQLFDQTCLTGRILLGRGQIESVAWGQFPTLLGMMNSYDDDGVFFRTTAKTQYIAITSGLSHTEANTTERRCAIATQQITADDAVKGLRAAYGYPAPIDLPGERGVTVKMMVGAKGALLVIPAGDHWVILRRDEILAGITPEQARVRAMGRKFADH